MKLHEKLYHLRKKKGLTQAELAEQLEVSRQSVSNWEVGTVVPSTKRLKDLSHLYEVPLDYLLDESSLENQVESQSKEATSSETEVKDSIMKPDSEKLQEKHNWLWITAAIILGVVLIALSVAAVVHRFDDKTGGDKAVLLNEWSNEEFGSETEGEFDFR